MRDEQHRAVEFGQRPVALHEFVEHLTAHPVRHRAPGGMAGLDGRLFHIGGLGVGLGKTPVGKQLVNQHVYRREIIIVVPFG